MRVGIILDGGAGRIISAIPALLKYVRNNQDHEVYIFCNGWNDLFWGIPELQKNLYTTEAPNIFQDVIIHCDKIIRPEPYQLPNYFKQNISLYQAFNEILNNTEDHSDLHTPFLVTSPQEKYYSQNTIDTVKQTFGKEKTVVIQPFGRSAEANGKGDVVDYTCRSLTVNNYLHLVSQLSSKYNVIFFGEPAFYLPQDTYTYKMECGLRAWASVIEASDYFIGCDSVGQHMARAVNTPGTVILGSSFAINTTYPDYFNIVERQGFPKRYSPIRLCETDSTLNNHLMHDIINFTDEEVNGISYHISQHIETPSLI